jgi:formylglycine-generating enzyme required for sulfatase activity
MQEMRWGSGYPLGLAGMTVLMCVGCQAQAEQPPHHWTLPVLELSASIAPLSVASDGHMITIPAGRYAIGRDKGPKSEQPQHEISIASFRIDRTEVTNAAFAEFLNALRLPVRGSFRIGEISLSNSEAATIALLGTAPDGTRRYPIIELDDSEARIILVDGRFQPEGYADHPVTETTWAGARAYCVWRGGDLPTEAQWEAAARDDDDRVYPWGNEQPDSERVSASGRTGVTTPVGSRPAGASPFGLLDMAGSLAEWTRSLKMPYPYLADDGRENVEAAGERVTRGGDYVYDRRASNFTVSFRDSYSNAPQHGHRHIGFRCVS